MAQRLVVWVLFLAICYGLFKVASGWSNPWSVPTAPIMSVLPAQPDGCGGPKGCL